MRVTIVALLCLAALTCALYLPFLSSPLVFDDRSFFTGSRFAERALSPFGLWLRGPPIFSIALVEVIWGRIEAHRLVGLALHIACALALYGVIRALQGVAADPARDRWHLAALAGATIFAVHPAAVYAAAYLGQRATVVATLFVLLSILLYLRGLRSGSYSDALVAALLYSLAVLSKENALLAPAAAAALVPLVDAGRRFALRYTACYFAACAPAAVLVALLSKGAIGQVYEPQFEAVAAQVTGNAEASINLLSSPWLGSAVAQAGLFWRYLALWLWPRAGEMSFDMRVDFADYWSPAIALPAVAAFLGFAAMAGFLIRKGGRPGMAGFGLLYVWIMFLVELAAIRFQEPFLLYRSYLWAPGLAIAAASLLGRLPRLALVLISFPVLSVLAWQVHDRLLSFSSGLALWEDAAAKLPPRPIPGGHRALYELGREYLYAGRNGDALRVTERCVSLYPDTYDCYFARGAIHAHLGEHENALPYFLRAVAMRPDAWGARLRLGLVLENLGCVEEAKVQYRHALSHGYLGGQHYLDRLESPGKGLLPPLQAPRAPGDCEKLLRSFSKPQALRTIVSMSV